MTPLTPFAPAAEAVLSLDDVHAESSLLRPHDLTNLHRRLEGAIRRRQIATALLAGAAALAAAGGLAHLATRDNNGATSSPPAPVIEQPLIAWNITSTSGPCTASEPAASTAPAQAPSTPAPIVIVREVLVKEAPSPSASLTNTVTLEGEDGERIVVEGSRLRAQLRIFDEGERALVGGDPERALARARHLRTRYPNGPLDIDAAILGVRALRALARDEEAREALTEAERHPLALEKGTVLAELRALLTPAPVEPPSRVIRHVDEAPQEADADEAGADAAGAAGADEDDHHPSRVIDPLTPAAPR